MEMDSIEVNGQTTLTESVSPENSVSTELSDNCGINGEPEILPRVGNEYQVEIPCLNHVSAYLGQSKNLDIVDITNVDSLDNVSAMSIPLMWIIEESENKDAIDIKLDVLERGSGYRLVPGCFDKSWSELEKSGFLLGLYVFGKNFVLIKTLIGSKEIGDILLYYYGRFYRSDMYLRWRGCGKAKSRKFNYGQRIFNGSRHQELLSRLLINASEECRISVLEMSKSFGEGKLVIEEYVFALEAKLGLCALVEAVGIGKGKRDLIGNAPETPKSHQSRREIPAGKPLSALSPKEILSILTGDFRLSKAKASDIFWECVWPRLLARGWHSEQPNSASNNLVYLKPGIKEFSRSELSKGDDFYDSVTDILSLIASDPDLLDIDGFENGWTGETKDVSNEPNESEQRHCYLKPRTPSRSSDGSAKFTVVDTSLGASKIVRELRSLPVKAPRVRCDFDEEEDDDGDSSEVFDAPKRKTFLESGSALLALPAYNGAQAKRASKKPKPTATMMFPKEEVIENDEKRVVKRRKKLLPLPAIIVSDSDPLKFSSSSTGSSGVAAAIHDSIENHIKRKTQIQTDTHRTFIDLNVPVSQTVEIDEVSVMGVTEMRKQAVDLSPVGPQKSKSKSPELDIVHRRQSTRNRPLTTKVLEAFAYGFMDTKHKKKRKPRDDNLMTRMLSRRVRSRADDSPSTVPAVEFSMEESQSSVQNAFDGDVYHKQVSD